MKCKIDGIKFLGIKNYAKSHSIAETASKFGVSMASVSQCKRFDTVDEYKKYNAEIRRRSYMARKSKLKVDNGTHFEPPKNPIDGTGGKTVDGDPFGDAAKPKPITPIGANRAPIQDGPMTTRKLKEEHKVFPMTPEQYRKTYAEQEVEIGKLKGQLAKANMDLKEWENKYNALNTLYSNLLMAYREKTALVKKMSRPLKVVGNVAETPETSSPTEIEITVGDATIRVSTKGNNA